MRLVGRDNAANWGEGHELDAEATEEWERVESYMKDKGLAVLTDIGMSSKQLRAAKSRIENTAAGTWRAEGTPGRYCKDDGRNRGGVLVIWDESHFTCLGHDTISAGRIMQLTLADRAGDPITILAAYTATSPSHVVSDST